MFYVCRMSSIDAEIAEYKLRVEEHRANIRNIEQDKDYKRFDPNCIAVIKSKEDAIHDCEAAILALRQQQQQSK